MLKTASTLPTFTPSFGHTYMPPAPRPIEASQTAMQSQQSKEENTPMADADSQTKAPLMGSQATSTSTTGPATTSNVGSSVQDTRALAESFSLLSRYGDEFMDENPLVGEPGSFILSRSGDVDRNTATATKQAQPSSTSTTAPGTATNAPTRVGTPRVTVDTPGKASVSASDKGGNTPVSEENKSRRKKSKAGS